MFGENTVAGKKQKIFKKISESHAGLPPPQYLIQTFFFISFHSTKMTLNLPLIFLLLVKFPLIFKKHQSEHTNKISDAKVDSCIILSNNHSCNI